MYGRAGFALLRARLPPYVLLPRENHNRRVSGSLTLKSAASNKEGIPRRVSFDLFGKFAEKLIFIRR